MDRWTLMSRLKRRVSKGEFERRAHSYDVHRALDTRGRPVLKAVDYVRNPDGTIKMGADGKPTPIVQEAVTLVLSSNTPREARKISMSDRFLPHSKRERYKGKPLGIIQRQNWKP